MEPENEPLEEEIPVRNHHDFRFQPLVFGGVLYPIIRILEPEPIRPISQEVFVSVAHFDTPFFNNSTEAAEPSQVIVGPKT